MTAESSEPLWLSASVELTVQEFSVQSGLSEQELAELIECGAISPVGAGPGGVRLPADALWIARTANRVRGDFELDSRGLALAFALLERIRALETELRRTLAQLPDPLR